MSSEPISAQSTLTAAYWRRRSDLLRLFVARMGERDSADDLLQELFLKLERLDGSGVDNAEAYVFRLAMNLLIDHQRQTIRRRRREAEWGQGALADDGASPSFAESPEAGLQRKQAIARLMTAIDELPPRTREAFRLHKLEELSHAAVATRMGISKSAVEKHIIRALRHLLSQPEHS